MEKKNHHGGEFQRGEIDFDFSVNINPLGMPEAAKRVEALALSVSAARMISKETGAPEPV